MPPKRTKKINNDILKKEFNEDRIIQPKEFKDIGTQTKFIYDDNDEPLIYNCKRCDYSTTNKHNFYLHHFNNHEKDKSAVCELYKFYCNVCGVGFNDISVLAKHLTTVKHIRREKNY